MEINWAEARGWIGALTGVLALGWGRLDKWREWRRDRRDRLVIETDIEGNTIKLKIALRLDGPGEAINMAIALGKPQDFFITHVTAPTRLKGQTPLSRNSRSINMTMDPAHSSPSGWHVTLTLRLANSSGGSTPLKEFSGTVMIRATTMSSRKRLISLTRHISAKA